MDFSKLKVHRALCGLSACRHGMEQVADLKEELKKRNLSSAGKKAELIARLEEAESGSTKRDADEPAEGESQAKKPKMEDSQDGAKPNLTGTSAEGPQIDVKVEEKPPPPPKEEDFVDVKPKEELEVQPMKDERESKPDVKDEPKEAGHGEVLERGHCYFFYRPKVDMSSQDVSGIEDIAKFELVLKPSGSKQFRHINVGRKQMPHADGGHRPFWAAVTAVNEDFDAIAEGLKSKHYETKTQGERTQPAARPAGKGSYVIHVEGEKSKRATHLAYVLSDPPEPGEVQRDLSIHKEGAFVIQVKDPHGDGPAGASLSADRRAQYPEKLQSLFRTKYRLAEPPELLDYGGVELLLIAAKSDLGQEIGEGEQQKLENEAEEEARANTDIYKELHLSSTEHPAGALKGEWA